MDEALKIFSCKAFGGEYLADFFAFAFRHQSDMPLLDVQYALVFVSLHLCSAVVARGHGKSVGNKICKAEQQHDR